MVWQSYFTAMKEECQQCHQEEQHKRRQTETRVQCEVCLPLFSTRVIKSATNACQSSWSQETNRTRLSSAQPAANESPIIVAWSFVHTGQEVSNITLFPIRESCARLWQRGRRSVCVCVCVCVCVLLCVLLCVLVCVCVHVKTVTRLYIYID